MKNGKWKICSPFQNQTRPVTRNRQEAHYRLIILQIVSGFTGISRCFTPKGDSASTMAPTIAGVASMVPGSPTPLTPKGLTGEGVSVRSNSNQGTCVALGTA